MDFNINVLPLEILTKVFTFLKPRERKNASLVCKRWRDATRCPSFFHTLHLTEGIYLDEAPLNLFKDYHPFTTVSFERIEHFEESLVTLWARFAESVTTLIFIACEGLTDEALVTILENMGNVKKIKIVGFNGLSGNQLESRFSSVTALDISETEMPQMYIEAIAESFPCLAELNLGSITYSGWDSHEEFLRNMAIDAVSSDFGSVWTRELARLAPKVTLKYESEVVLKTDVILREFAEVPNLQVTMMVLAMQHTSLEHASKFLEKHGQFLQILRIENANMLTEAFLNLFKKTCSNLHTVEFSFTGPQVSGLPGLFEALSSCNRLEHVTISQFSKEAGEISLATKRLNFPYLKKLEFLRLDLEPLNWQLEFLLQSCPNLKDLIVFTDNLSRGTFEVISRSCQRLEAMNLRCQVIEVGDRANELFFACLECLYLHMESGASILERLNCPQLRTLRLFNEARVSKKAMSSFCRKSPILANLDLRECFYVNDKFIARIVDSLPRLENIYLMSTRITTKSIELIQKSCPMIKDVNVSIQPQDSKKAEELIMKRVVNVALMPMLERLSNSVLLENEEHEVDFDADWMEG